MNEKNSALKLLNSKFINFFGGIGLSLLSVVLMMNVGYIARVLAAPFFFAFGTCSYVAYALMYIGGIYIVFKDKAFRFKKVSTFLGVLIIAFGFMLLATLISTKDSFGYLSLNTVLGAGQSEIVGQNEGPIYECINFHEAYTTIYSALKADGGYFGIKFIDVFKEYNFGGGYLGFAVVGLINGLTGGESVSYVVAICLMLLGIVVAIMPFIVKAIKKQFKPKTELATDKQDMQIKNAPEIQVSEDFPTQIPEEPKIKETHHFFKRKENARAEQEIEPEQDRPIFKNKLDEKIISKDESLTIKQDDAPIKEEPQFTNDVKKEQKNNFLFEQMGSFRVAKFNWNGGKEGSGSNPTIFDQGPVKAVPKFSTQEERIPETVVEEKSTDSSSQVSAVSSIEEVKREQMTLDFEDPNKVDLSMVQPVYQEPISVQRKEDIQKTINAIPNAVDSLKFIPPSSDLLDVYETSKSSEQNDLVAAERQKAINEAFDNLHIGAKCIGYTIGPSVTRFHIQTDLSVSIKNVSTHIPDLCVRLGGVQARFEQIVPGQCYSGLEVPNAITTTVSFKETFEGLPDVEKHPLSIPFGKNIAGETIYADFNDFPHMLVAGTTGSGKSVYIHSVIMSLIMRNSPADLRLVLVDPKQVEMNMYVGMPHLLCPIIYEADQAKVALTKLTDEMDYRYSLFRTAGVLNIKDYNKWAEKHGKKKFNFIIVVVDEYAECVETCKDISLPLTRLSGKARACGIHMLIATQRPSVNIVTGVLKSNLPTHVALMTANSVDSTTILNEGGAEKLLGKGDMLVQSPLVSRVGAVRLQSPFIQVSEITRVVENLKENYPTVYDPDYLDLVDHSKENARAQMLSNGYGRMNGEDEHMENDPDEGIYNDIKDWVTTLDYCSMSRIQREFSVGFNRAGRLFKRLQKEGYVENNDNPSNAKGCKVLISNKFGVEERIELNDSQEEDSEDTNEIGVNN